jgi:hypothetical protein
MHNIFLAQHPKGRVMCNWSGLLSDLGRDLPERGSEDESSELAGKE